MRKILLIVLCAQSVLVYAQNEEKVTTAESWLDFGLGWEYDFFDADTTMIPDTILPKSLIGLVFKAYNFANNKNIGLFGQYGIFGHLPLEEQPGGYYSTIQFECSFGAAFRLPLGNKFNLFAGLGGNLNVSSYAWQMQLSQGTEIIDTFDYSLSISKIGLLCDLGLKIDITDKTYISVGSMFLLSYVTEEAEIYHHYDENDTWHEYREEENSYGLFRRIRPYIAIGTNSWSDKSFSVSVSSMLFRPSCVTFSTLRLHFRVLL
jgi:hypothetical protein